MSVHLPQWEVRMYETSADSSKATYQQSTQYPDIDEINTSQIKELFYDLLLSEKNSCINIVRSTFILYY
jgi:hypothetical protein